MQWRITGADRATGEDKTITVDADDEREAVLRAKESNLLVEKIEMTQPIRDYKGPPLIQNPPSLPMWKEPIRRYAKLEDVCLTLTTLAMFLSALGWLSMLGAVAAVIAMFNAAPAVATENVTALGNYFITLIITAMVFGIACFFAAGIARFFGHAGEALRDIAINSQK